MTIGLLHTSNLPPLMIHIFRSKNLLPYNSVSSEHQHKLIDGEKFQAGKFLRNYVMVLYLEDSILQILSHNDTVNIQTTLEE